jgi:hypothetical protein
MLQKFHQALVESAEAIINPVALCLSCGLLVYFYINITDSVLFKIIFAVAAVYVDLLAWLTWGRAHAYSDAAEEAKDKLKLEYQTRAIGLRVCTFIYLILCSMPADVSFFMTELGTKEQAARVVSDNYEAAKARIKVIDAQTLTYNAALSKEVETSFRGRSQMISDKMDTLATERAGLVASMQAPEKTSQKLFKNPFKSLATVLHMQPDTLKAITFIMLVFMIQLGLLLTPWTVSIKGLEALQKPKENLPEVSQSFTVGPSAEPDPELLKVINNMYKTIDGVAGPLRGDQAISELTGIPPARCAEIKNVLCRTTVENKPLVSKRAGVCETEFSKREMLEHIKRGLKGVV